jgi:hypothetical protein
MNQPAVTVKRKNVTALFDYCLDNRIEFAVKPSVSVIDEFDVEFNLSDITKAIAFGMFLREMKLELNGVAQAPKNTVKKAAAPSAKEIPAVKEEAASLAFAEDTINFDLESN